MSCEKRKVYLIRHGEPEFAGGRRVCLSTDELELSVQGRMRAALTAAAIPKVTQVFCSPLVRARQTAQQISDDAKITEELREIGMGSWDGLAFDEIKKRWPELYEMRGVAPFDCVPEGAEAPADCLSRAEKGLVKCLEGSRGDIAVVAHSGVNRLLLCKLEGRQMNDFLKIPQPYGCINTLVWDGERFSAETTGEQPHPSLTEETCLRLLKAAKTPDKVVEHALAVTGLSQRVGEALVSRGYDIDLPLLRAAALMHDVARTERNHARLGGEWLTALGYPEVGQIIERHHDLPEQFELSPNESAVLFLADKLTQGSERVTIDERFSESYKKCTTDEARRSHDRRYAQAKRVESMMIGAAKDVI